MTKRKGTSSSLEDENKRHWLVAILLHIGIRIRYLFESWFLIRPLFLGASGYKSPYRPKNMPEYDTITSIGFVWIWLFIGLSRQPMSFPIVYIFLCKSGIIHIINRIHSWLINRLIKQFEDAGWKPINREIPVPEYDWKKGNPKEFYNLFVKNLHPVVLRGFMKDTEMLKKLDWDVVLKTYGEEEVLLTTKDVDGYIGKLKEVDTPSVYLHNSEKLFNKYPELRKLFQYERLEPYTNMKVGYEQFFIGRKGTGSPFHNAPVYNMFYQINGKKKWYWVDPYDTYLIYPVAVTGRAAFMASCLYPDNFNEKAFPLFSYCPVYSTELQPGDVIFNPPWWWHGIKNITETTVAVASRWHTDGIAGHKLMMTEEDYEVFRYGTCSFFIGLNSWPFLHGILQQPSPKFDEHTTIREKRNRYTDKQREVAEDGGVNKLGVTVKC